jgi:phosphonopyruvate decarboxylase
MLSPHYFIEQLQIRDIGFFTGVPDSLLKDICAYIADNIGQENNITAVNEGGAIALAAGYYIATGNIPLVYMQNSGLGNAINPLLSLVDKEIYNIPLLMLIGWRGKPGIKDEPQHIKQGRITMPLLNVLEIKHMVLSKNCDESLIQINEACNFMKTQKEPFAFIIEKDTFEAYTPQNKTAPVFQLGREEAIKMIVDNMDAGDVVVSTTGMISRELFEYREKKRQGHERDFLSVGSMGHASQIALGIALKKKENRVYCFDGDGSVLMHMGSMAIIGTTKPTNYIHIVFNNGAHDSVGGQPTAALRIELNKIAISCGYQSAFSLEYREDIIDTLNTIKGLKGPVFLEIKVNKGARKDLGRPTRSPVLNKEDLMYFLRHQH